MFRRAVSSLLARRFPHARSLHSLIGDGLLCAYTFAAAVSAGGGLAVAVLHFKKLEDMKARFERWIVKNNKTYRDEEEKAMRFRLFKATVEFIESHPLSVQRRSFPEVNYFADYTEQEKRCMLAYPDGFDMNEYYEILKSALAAEQEKAERH